MLESREDINVLSTGELTGIAAGKKIEACIVKLQEEKETIRIVFAAAPSQDAMLDYLSKSKIIKWNAIIAFNMDEYIGLPEHAPQSFANYLEENLYSNINLKEKHTINPGSDIDAELNRYAHLIKEAPIDIVCLGIGENGHIAFNDPPVADFDDSHVIKAVHLDKPCRMQQVHDGCFEKLEDVPERALTLTIPTLLSGTFLFCVVLGAKKSAAVRNTFAGKITTACPASILTTHEHCEFFFDEAAFKEARAIKSKILND
ncbi:6-phosphogluconolactonase [Leeuwenhoekiella polynyae]|uniref:Glucosamine-6-phosphate deaminase n=1 Tax=Leeuwenhoekiella polynyae TaxID=1550906 RepID=A0A4Q0PGM4_9FLAO|nr:6-phosphogluconolactonase [Leeuwenhoekiella polynyae]RXG26096.1 glucosamine-6-phosphate deaminase [Leeuwenhoekiella polynyae]